MQNLVWKIVFIIAVLVGCALLLYPPDQKIRLGKDLRGGTSLIYKVNMDEKDARKQEILTQVISVLKERVNPKGVLDISMQPMGLDRIEIVMPLPSDKVRGLRQQYDTALADLVMKAEVKPAQLDEALQFNRAVQEFGGAERVETITKLQEAHNRLQDARKALEDAQAANVSGDELARLELAVANAEVAFDQLHDSVLGRSLDESRVMRMLNASTKREIEKDAADKPVIDPATGEPKLGPSQRDFSLAGLKAEFPQLAEQIDRVVQAYDAYQNSRSGFDDPEDLIRLLRGAGVLEFRIAVQPGQAQGVSIPVLRTQLAELGPNHTDSPVARWFPINDIKQWVDKPEHLSMLQADPVAYFENMRGLVGAEYEDQYYVLLYTDKARAMTHTGDSWKIESTRPSIDRLGRPAVEFRLDPAGGQLMSRLTGPHVNQPMAIVLDGQVYSAPNLNSQIGSSGIIEGDFSQSELSYLLRVLAAGALEARLSDRPIAVNTLGPTIGAENLHRGLMACLYSIICVAGFMLVYYFGAGFIAIIALAANGLFIFGVMALIEGTFTLPGLAGIALTIGTAVDANILIYERIREELERGEVDLRGAVRLGYDKALSAIVDSNLTNLVVCIALIMTGTTEVKGFAYTMTIGIVGTLFTALFMTRVMYTILIEFFGLRRLPMLTTTVPAVKQFLEPHIDWIGLRKVLIPLSIVMVVGSWVLLISRGAAIFDTEFRGGISATMRTAVDPATKQRVLLKQGDVETRIHNVGAAADAGTDDPSLPQKKTILRELRNAEVLTVGDTSVIDGRIAASAFQIKVALPSELGDVNSSQPSGRQVSANDLIISAIVDEFGDQLDVARPLEFAGLNSTDHSKYTYPIASPELGVNIKQDEHRQNVRSFLGGVAVVVKDISPPVTTEEVVGRLRRMRDQPDFRDAFGRSMQVIGLDPADPTDPSKGFKSLAVLVTDPLVDYGKVDFEVWDSRLAAREWALVSQALERPASLEQISEFSSAVAQTLRANAVVAVFLSVLGILVYIWVRFGSLRYSAGAVLALVHDVSIGLGALALSQYVASTAFGKNLLLMEFHIDLEVVAAVLTLIGYSLNDTIVILDRIRENRGKLQFPTAEIVNKSINQTFSRTILTNLTMLISLLVLYVVGGPGIRAFAFVMLVGMFVGTYSTVAIAAPLVFKGHDNPPPKGSKREIEPVLRESVAVGR